MNQRVISFHYTLTNPSGEKLDSSEGSEPLMFMEGVGQIIPGLETQLAKLKVGDKKKINVKAADAYGLRDPKNVVTVPRDKMPAKTIKVGDQFQSSQNHGMPLTVTKVTDKDVTLDANHPLAGVDLTFDVHVTGLRDATAEELQHGHAHGGDGHHH